MMSKDWAVCWNVTICAVAYIPLPILWLGKPHSDVS